MFKKIALKTPAGESLVEISEEIRGAIAEAGVQEGICAIFIPHTTAAVTINSRMDPNTATDLVGEMDRIVPTRVDFHHQFDTPADASGHIKTTLVGPSQTIIVSQGKAMLGSSQGIFFCEYDGPRSREVWVRVIVDR